MQVRSLGWEDSLEEGMTNHSSILAQRIPWTEEPGELQSIGSQSQTGLKQSSIQYEGLMDVAICGLSFSLFCLNYNLLLGATWLP